MGTRRRVLGEWLLGTGHGLGVTPDEFKGSYSPRMSGQAVRCWGRNGMGRPAPLRGERGDAPGRVRLAGWNSDHWLLCPTCLARPRLAGCEPVPARRHRSSSATCPPPRNAASPNSMPSAASSAATPGNRPDSSPPDSSTSIVLPERGRAGHPPPRRSRLTAGPASTRAAAGPARRDHQYRRSPPAPAGDPGRHSPGPVRELRGRLPRARALAAGVAW